MSDRVSAWRQSFQKAKGALAQATHDVQKWELLDSKSAPGRSERAKQGAIVRGKISELKNEMDRLKRELDSLSANSTANQVTRKSITQFQDEFTQVSSEVIKLQGRAKGGLTGNAESSLPVSAFVPNSGGQETGVEIQPVSNRSLLQQQQQQMQGLEDSCGALEGTVNNLQRVSNMIRGEVVSQNRLLDNANNLTDRVDTNIGRGRNLLSRLQSQHTRCLYVFLVAILVVLIVIFVEVVIP
eukprot:TRINITY_DN113978_c0_g1_i1.p1 TRINITY_DN113978_c0_g1~~TRINITY_DN113978_c0_g1_i1.p1  ORF type:complete len:275 (+),score=43.88 TRINITY_DN113978_c0_g1_i1:105-827(+)